MKRFLKKINNKETFIVAGIVLLALFIRFYNFPNRVTFWSEQARSLIVSANYLSKPSLLGQEYFRQDSNSHIIYSGALFNYLLLPLIIIAKGNTVAITAFFGLLNILTGVLLYIFCKKFFGSTLAVFSTILFLFNDYMVYHSLFIWNYNLLPLIGLLLVFFIWRANKFGKAKDAFWIGIFSGIGVSIQILFAPIALASFIYLVLKIKKLKSKGIILFLAGFIIPNLPLVLFDLRHHFYETITIFNFLIDTLKGKSSAGFSYYYLLPFWPLAAIFGGKLLEKIYKWKKIFVLPMIILYIYINLLSSKINFIKPTGMPDGLTVKDIDNASRVIADNANSGFNVSEVMDFDKRAYVLRYYTEFVYKKKPLDEISYKDINNLYVLSPVNFDYKNTKIWEVTASKYNHLDLLSDIGKGYAVYKLSN